MRLELLGTVHQVLGAGMRMERAMIRPKHDNAALAQQFAKWLDAQQSAANDDEPVIDEEALRERARLLAEQVRRARKR